MYWKHPPLNKVYEALGAIGDKRITLDGNKAKVYSSSGNKYYDVEYKADTQEITSNDNASYWAGYLGYPAIALLLAKGIIKYEPILAKYLSDFAWKDINQSFGNNLPKTNGYVDEQIEHKYHIDLDEFHNKLNLIRDQVIALRLKKLGKTKRPPSAY